MNSSDQFRSAVSRLHGPSCREQLAGARDLAELAERWHLDGANAQAQRCVDALCAHVRVRRYTRSPRSEQAESAVREQITSLLMDFLRSGPGAAPGGLLVNLTSVGIRGRHDFTGVSFGPGLRLILDGAQLEADARLSFDGCHFRGCIVRLHEVSLAERASLSLVGLTVEAGAWLVASTARVHPTAHVDLRGIAAPGNAAPVHSAVKSRGAILAQRAVGHGALPEKGKTDNSSTMARARIL